MEQVEDRIEEGVRRLLRAIEREAARSRFRFSRDAWGAVCRQLDQFEEATPASFGVGADGVAEGENKEVAAGLRGFARRYAAVFGRGDTVEDLAAEMCQFTPMVSWRGWCEILRGRDGDPSLMLLREAARLLRDGMPRQEVEARTGLSESHAKQLASFARVGEWVKEERLTMAFTAMDEGWSLTEFAARWNETVPRHLHMGKSTAGEVLKKARALDDLEYVIDMTDDGEAA